MKSIIIVFSFLYATSSLAEIFINAGGIVRSRTEEFSGVETTESIRYLDAKFGWKHPKGYLLGYHYSSNVASEEQSTSTYESETEITATGPTIGIMGKKDNTFYLMATFFFKSEMTRTNVGSLDYEGSGTQLDLGYKVQVKKTGFGISLTYKNHKFDRYVGAYSSLTLENEIIYNDLVPQIQFWIII